jgi:hypothetical protein
VVAPSAPITVEDEKAGTYSRVEMSTGEETHHDVVQSKTRAELEGTTMAYELDGGYNGTWGEGDGRFYDDSGRNIGS